MSNGAGSESNGGGGESKGMNDGRVGKGDERNQKPGKSGNRHLLDYPNWNSFSLWRCWEAFGGGGKRGNHRKWKEDLDEMTRLKIILVGKEVGEKKKKEKRRSHFFFVFREDC